MNTDAEGLRYYGRFLADGSSKFALFTESTGVAFGRVRQGLMVGAGEPGGGLGSIQLDPREADPGQSG